MKANPVKISLTKCSLWNKVVHACKSLSKPKHWPFDSSLFWEKKFLYFVKQNAVYDILYAVSRILYICMFVFVMSAVQNVHLYQSSVSVLDEWYLFIVKCRHIWKYHERNNICCWLCPVFGPLCSCFQNCNFCRLKVIWGRGNNCSTAGNCNIRELYLRAFDIGFERNSIFYLMF